MERIAAVVSQTKTPNTDELKLFGMCLMVVHEFILWLSNFNIRHFCCSPPVKKGVLNFVWMRFGEWIFAFDCCFQRFVWPVWRLRFCGTPQRIAVVIKMKSNFSRDMTTATYTVPLARISFSPPFFGVRTTWTLNNVHWMQTCSTTSRKLLTNEYTWEMH